MLTFGHGVERRSKGEEHWPPDCQTGRGVPLGAEVRAAGQAVYRCRSVAALMLVSQRGDRLLATLLHYVVGQTTLVCRPTCHRRRGQKATVIQRGAAYAVSGMQGGRGPPRGSWGISPPTFRVKHEVLVMSFLAVGTASIARLKAIRGAFRFLARVS